MRLHLGCKHLREETLTDVRTKVLDNKCNARLYNLSLSHTQTKKGKIFNTDLCQKHTKEKSRESTELTKPTPQ